MNCKTVEMLMYNYIDNELTEQEYLEIEEHLTHCKSCKALYDYELNFKSEIKTTLEKENVKVPEDLKDKILKNRKVYVLNTGFFNIKNISGLAALFFSALFISKFTMGYSTIEYNYADDLKKEIKVISNNKEKLYDWIKRHKYKNFKILKFKDKNFRINPLGIAFDNTKPILIYHYKGYKVAYKNISNADFDDFKELKLNGKKYFLKNNKGINTVAWKNNDGNFSVLSSDMPSSQFKNILYFISE